MTEDICRISRVLPSLNLRTIFSLQVQGVLPQSSQGTGSQIHGIESHLGQAGFSQIQGSLSQSAHNFLHAQGKNPQSLQGTGSQVQLLLPQILQLSGGGGSPSHSGSAKL